MTPLRIRCPQCGKSLQLPDRRWLGRRGKCTACGHAFVLQEPEIELQPVPELVADPAAFPGPLSDVSSIGAEAPAAAEPGALLFEIRRKRARRQKRAIAAGTVTALVIVGAIAFVQSQLSSKDNAAKTTVNRPDLPQGSQSLAAAIDRKPVSAAALQSNAELVAEVRPTYGSPINFQMLPSGVNLVIHLRPAELWAEQPRFQELRGALTRNVTVWIEQQLLAICRRRPDQMDEALIGLLLGPTGSTPEVAAVVRLREPAKLSDLVEEFRGEPVRPETSLRLFRSDTHAYLIRDERTFAVCPADLAEDLADWVDTPNLNTTDGILQLLSATDREHLFTVLFEVDDVRRHADWLFAADVRPALQQFLDVLGDESETASWSIHLAEEFYSELHVRTRVAGAEDILGPRGLAETLSVRMTDVPPRLLTAVRTLDPRPSGARRLIGRLPAMVETARRATVATTGERQAQFTTLLPAKAAPNLALAALLTWDEARRSGGASSATPTASTSSPQLPAAVAERLQLPVDAEFRRTPLRDALAYICNEISVNLEIDGDALKDAGYTQNMPQVFNIGKVPADVALSRIFSRYTGDGKAELQMVAVLNEGTQTLLVTTRKFADRDGLTPLDLPPSPE